jgi:hypothetical protein
MTPTHDILAWNQLAAALMVDFGVVGEITLDWDALTSDAEPDQQLVVYTAEPGSRSEEALRELSTWAAEQIDPSG